MFGTPEVINYLVTFSLPCKNANSNQKKNVNGFKIQWENELQLEKWPKKPHERILNVFFSPSRLSESGNLLQLNDCPGMCQEEQNKTWDNKKKLFQASALSHNIAWSHVTQCVLLTILFHFCEKNMKILLHQHQKKNKKLKLNFFGRVESSLFSTFGIGGSSSVM